MDGKKVLKGCKWMFIRSPQCLTHPPSAKTLPWWPWSQTPGHKFALRWAIEARNGSRFHPSTWTVSYYSRDDQSGCSNFFFRGSLLRCSSMHSFQNTGFTISCKTGIGFWIPDLFCYQTIGVKCYELYSKADHRCENSGIFTQLVIKVHLWTTKFWWLVQLCFPVFGVFHSINQWTVPGFSWVLSAQRYHLLQALFEWCGPQPLAIGFVPAIPEAYRIIFLSYTKCLDIFWIFGYFWGIWVDTLLDKSQFIENSCHAARSASAKPVSVRVLRVASWGRVGTSRSVHGRSFSNVIQRGF